MVDVVMGWPIILPLNPRGLVGLRLTVSMALVVLFCVEKVMTIILKTAEEIAQLREAGRLAGEVLDYIAPFIQVGVNTATLDQLCHDYMVQVQKTVPAPLNYAPHGHRPYPKSICTSINHQVCHGIPAENKILKDGDIVNVDITVITAQGWHGDSSRMFLVGKPSVQARRLCELTFQAMWIGIRQVKPGATLGDVGAAIQRFTENNGYSVVREFCGHGIGQKFHEDPQVMHYGKAGSGIKLQPGMVFTIEPMINAGKAGIKVLGDGWTVVTKDHSLSAQWEHMVAVTADGYEVLSLSAGALADPFA